MAVDIGHMALRQKVKLGAFQMCSTTMGLSGIIVFALVLTLVVWGLYETSVFLWKNKPKTLKSAIWVWALPETLHQRFSNS